MTDRTNEAKWSDSKGRWRIDVQRDGVRKSFYSAKEGRKGKLECQQKADKWLEQGGNADNVRVDALLDMWLGQYKKVVSTTAYTQYESYVRRDIKETIGKIKIEKLEMYNLQGLLDNLSARGLSAKTIRNYRGCLSSFLKWCREHKYTSLRCDDLTIPKNASKSEKHILSAQEFAVVFSSDETTYKGSVVKDFYINAYRIMLICGLRPGEMLGLHWDDIDFETMRMNVKRSINSRGETTSGKNENARRSIGLNNFSLEVLKSQSAMLKQVGLVAENVFPNKSGGQLTLNEFQNAWKRYQEHNGIGYCTPYELRHTFVSSNKTIPEGLVKTVMGHSKDMDTFGVYGHLFDDDVAQAAAHIEDNLNKILH